MSVYNGLPPHCVQELKHVELFLKDSQDPSFIFEFKGEGDEFLYESENIPAGSYSIKPFEIKCGDKVIQFGNMNFEAVELEGEVKTSKSLLVTYDLANPAKGQIKVGKHNAPLQKVNNGMPEIK